MIEKIPIEKLNKLSSKELADYIINITQTPICNDVKYCKALNNIFIRSKTKIMTTEKVKKTRTSRTPETIAKGLLSLPLQDRVNILKQLKASIDEEVEQREQQAAEAKKIANGL